MPESRRGGQGMGKETKEVIGFWRCPVDNKVYMEESSNFGL